MIDAKHIWDFIQSTHEKYKNKGGFTLLDSITIVSVDKLYLVNCYSSDKRMEFSIFIDYKNLFTDEQVADYTILPATICPKNSSISEKITDNPQEIWDFMKPIMRDISISKLGINS